MKKMVKKMMLAAAMLSLTTMVSAQRYESAYSVRGNEAIYEGRVIREADAKSFQILGHGYAKDRYNVYLDGQVLRFVDPQTFRLYERDMARPNPGRPGNIVGGGHRGDYVNRPTYHMDRFNVYFNGEKVQGASASSFKDLGDGYGCDSFSAYYFGKKIHGSTGSSFQVIGYGYSKDAFNVYYDGVKLNGVSGNRFELLGYGYSKDAFNVFYNGEKVQGASTSSFHVDRDGYAHDNFNTYYFGKKIR